MILQLGVIQYAGNKPTAPERQWLPDEDGVYFVEHVPAASARSATQSQRRGIRFTYRLLLLPVGDCIVSTESQVKGGCGI